MMMTEIRRHRVQTPISAFRRASRATKTRIATNEPSARGATLASTQLAVQQGVTHACQAQLMRTAIQRLRAQNVWRVLLLKKDMQDHASHVEPDSMRMPGQLSAQTVQLDQPMKTCSQQPRAQAALLASQLPRAMLGLASRARLVSTLVQLQLNAPTAQRARVTMTGSLIPRVEGVCQAFTRRLDWLDHALDAQLVGSVQLQQQ